MAISMRILLAFPTERENKFGLIGWEVRDMIDVGRIVRFENLVAAESGGKFDSHERAGICMARVILDRLDRRMGVVPDSGTAERSDFAPHMLQYTVGKDDNGIALAFAAGAKGYLDCGPRDESLVHMLEADKGRLYPSGRAMKKHNAFVALGNTEMAKFLIAGKYTSLTDAPLMWAKCEDMTHWMEEGMEEMTLFEEVTKTGISCARYGAWSEYLGRLGDCDARAIFVFPSLDVMA